MRDFFEWIQYLRPNAPPSRADVCHVVQIHGEVGSENKKFFDRIGHRLEVAFQHGTLHPEVYSECTFCGKDHSKVIEEFIDEYLLTTDGASIVRHSQLERMLWASRGMDSTIVDAVAAYQNGALGEKEFLKTLKTGVPLIEYEGPSRPNVVQGTRPGQQLDVPIPNAPAPGRMKPADERKARAAATMIADPEEEVPEFDQTEF